MTLIKERRGRKPRLSFYSISLFFQLLVKDSNLLLSLIFSYEQQNTQYR